MMKNLLTTCVLSLVMFENIAVSMESIKCYINDISYNTTSNIDNLKGVFTNDDKNIVKYIFNNVTGNSYKSAYNYCDNTKHNLEKIFGENSIEDKMFTFFLLL